MGNKIIKLLLTLILVPTLSFADQIDYGFKVIEETNGVKLTRSMISIVPKDIGVGVMTTHFQSDLNEKRSNSLLFVSNIKQKDYDIIGNIGVGQVEQKNYLVGDITGTYKLKSNMLLNLSVYGDLVDSVNALANNTTVKGLVVGTDYWKDNFNIALGHRTAWYSNNNTQQGYYIKPGYSFADGFNFYLTKRYYKNSNPYNGQYFSPETYDRSGYGLSFRHKIGTTTLYGHFENTKINTPVNSDSILAWKVDLTVPISNDFKGKIMAGKDYSNSSGFNYNYFEISLSYQF